MRFMQAQSILYPRTWDNQSVRAKGGTTRSRLELGVLVVVTDRVVITIRSARRRTQMTWIVNDYQVKTKVKDSPSAILSALKQGKGSANRKRSLYIRETYFAANSNALPDMHNVVSKTSCTSCKSLEGTMAEGFCQCCTKPGGGSTSALWHSSIGYD